MEVDTGVWGVASSVDYYGPFESLGRALRFLILIVSLSCDFGPGVLLPGLLASGLAVVWWVRCGVLVLLAAIVCRGWCGVFSSVVGFWWVSVSGLTSHTLDMLFHALLSLFEVSILGLQGCDGGHEISDHLFEALDLSRKDFDSGDDGVVCSD